MSIQRWSASNGRSSVDKSQSPLSVTPSKILANLKATVLAPLSEREMQQIGRIDRNCRLVKGQVFLWKGSRDGICGIRREK